MFQATIQYNTLDPKDDLPRQIVHLLLFFSYVDPPFHVHLKWNWRSDVFFSLFFSASISFAFRVFCFFAGWHLDGLLHALGARGPVWADVLNRRTRDSETMTYRIVDISTDDLASCGG